MLGLSDSQLCLIFLGFSLAIGSACIDAYITNDGEAGKIRLLKWLKAFCLVFATVFLFCCYWLATMMLASGEVMKPTAWPSLNTAFLGTAIAEVLATGMAFIYMVANCMSE